MSMPHATSYGLDWPFTPKRREKKPAAALEKVTQSIGAARRARRGPVWMSTLSNRVNDTGCRTGNGAGAAI